MTEPVVVAGAAGDLGGRIVRALLDRGAPVRVLARPDASPEPLRPLTTLGAEVVTADVDDLASTAEALAGAQAVVSAWNGLRDVILDRQTVLLDAAVRAGVPRFVPSDYALDFTRTPVGLNRNLDLRREFAGRVDRAPVRATSVLVGAFAELLTGPMPLLQPRVRRVLHWGDPDQPLDFTTKDDTAAVTAAAALDRDAPRWVRFAGDTLSVRELAEVASEVSGERYRLLRLGSVASLRRLATVVRAVSPSTDDPVPPWQGMQYLRDMLSGDGRLTDLSPAPDGRVPTTVRDLLARELGRSAAPVR